MAGCSPDIMSIDQHVDMRDAIQRIGPKFAVQVRQCHHEAWAKRRPALTLCSCTSGGASDKALQKAVVSRLQSPFWSL